MAVSPVAMRGLYTDLFGSSMLPVLEEIFKTEIEQFPRRRDTLFKVVNTDRDIWQATELHDLDLFSTIAEGSEYTFKRPRQGSNKTLTISKYGLGFSISEEMVADGKFDLIADMTRMLANSATESQEVNAMNIFNNGFSSETTSDGLSVFNSAHTLPSGSTFRNKLSVDSDLSASTLETMLYDFETQFVGDTGIKKNMKPMYLVVNPQNKRYAMELVGSDGKPDTADNNLNSFKNEGLQVISSPHLTDLDAWFMVAAPAQTGLRIVTRTPIETKAADPAVGWTTDSILYKSRYREAIGVTHAFGVFGTPGA